MSSNDFFPRIKTFLDDETAVSAHHAFMVVFNVLASAFWACVHFYSLFKETKFNFK
jgi:hypothetical protein